MDSMMSAIKARRGAQPTQMPEQEAPQEEGMGMQDLVMQLSPEQKQELMGLLTQESSGDTTGIEKGAPASGETAEIDQKMNDQDMGDESDEVQMGMLDRNSLQKAEMGVKPRGLGDRAKMMAAQKLKSKGKIK